MGQQKIDFSAAEEKQLEEDFKKNKLSQDEHRLAFYMLMDAAMCYREMYFRDDIEKKKAAKPPDIMISRPKGHAKMTQKTLNKMHRDALALDEKRMLFFNKKVYEEIDATKKSMSEQGQRGFDKLTEFMVVAAEELLVARDQHEVVALLKLYNRGDLNMMFEGARKEAVEQYMKKNNNENNNS